MEMITVERSILIVDGNLEHIHVIEQVLSQSPQPYKVTALAEGQQALDFLFQRGLYLDAERPDLILLDLSLPCLNSSTFLEKIKADPQLRRIPIVVLATSAHEDDVLRTYLLQGNCYVVKSTDLKHLAQIVKRIEDFWLGIVTLPLQ
jgi:two-component system, chemotaxis family, response regulator Rcp1